MSKSVALKVNRVKDWVRRRHSEAGEPKCGFAALKLLSMRVQDDFRFSMVFQAI